MHPPVSLSPFSCPNLSLSRKPQPQAPRWITNPNQHNIMDWPNASRRRRAEQPAGPCPPACQPGKQVRFDKKVTFAAGTKPGARSVHNSSDKGNTNRSSSSGGSDKTRYPQPPPRRPAKGPKMPGLSSVHRDFQTRRPVPVPKPTHPLPRSQLKPKPEPDARVSIPMSGASYEGTPKSRRPGYEWVSYEIRVKPTARVW